MDKYNFISFVGIFILLGFAWLFSRDKKNMNWKVIFWGIGIQFIFAFFIFVFPPGSKIFLLLNNLVVKILSSSTKGAEFIFGRLALPPGEMNETGEQSLGFFLAFQAFPTIIFFSALISILYYFNIMQWILKGFAYVFTKLMRLSGAESLCTASNIFVGIESVLTIKPHLKEMTQSELCTILTAGMATVASNVLAIYIFSLKEQFPSIAAHLISASILSAPSALVASKIIFPEKESPKTLGEYVDVYYEKESSFFEAIINGANSGVKLIVGIVALLIAVLGLVSLVDLFIGGLGNKINALFGINIDWSIKGFLGYIFYPFTLILGVPPSDALIISKIIGERAILTEVPAYQHLSIAISSGLIKNPRSIVIATYALCGFAHLASMAIFVGGIATLIPEKRKILAKLGPKALLGATIACLLTACVAGTFFTKNSILIR
ncbi:MAG: nucleoside transporter C-terminal domain-containing protein [candidate division WOR-3 bacterium]